MSERCQHTLTGCSSCAHGYRPRDMVQVGDERLCVRCAGAEIGRLRQCVEFYTDEDNYIDFKNPETAIFAGEYTRAVLGKEQP